MKSRLILADSDSSLIYAYRSYLERRGFDVLTTLNLYDCSERLLETDPEAVILENDLATASDARVLDQLFDECRARSIPVVLTLGAASADDMSNLVTPPIVACLRKPFRMSSLYDALERITLLRGRKPARKLEKRTRGIVMCQCDSH